MDTTILDRPYQTAAKLAIQREWDAGNKRTLLVLPTGTGKTIVFCRLIEDAVRAGQRALILAHRGELLDQAADKLARTTGLGVAVEQADSTALNEFFRVTVGSVQSLMRPQRLARFDMDYYDIVIVDEAHHVLADSYQRVLSHFGNAHVLGVTATPDRGDLRNLGEYFDSLAYEYSIVQAIRDGYLCPIKALTLPLKLDISGVRQSTGDYQLGDLGTALDPYLEQIAHEMVIHCNGRKTVVFMPLIATGQKFTAMLQDAGFRAVEVNGDSPDRTEILQDFDGGRYDVLVNAMLLTEGWDCPSVDCIVPLRATKIRSLFAQMVGRGTRIYPGKADLLLIDFLWHTGRLDLCRPACLISQTTEVDHQMTEAINAAGGPVDLIETEVAAESDVVTQREEALAVRLREQRHKNAKLVDPLQFEMSIVAEDLADYRPSFGWESARPTEGQVDALEKAGLNPDGVDCAGKASVLLERISKRRSAGLTTPKQIRFLEGKGFSRVGTWQFGTARKLIDRIAGNGWRVPVGIHPATYTPKQGE